MHATHRCLDGRPFSALTTLCLVDVGLVYGLVCGALIRFANLVHRGTAQLANALPIVKSVRIQGRLGLVFCECGSLAEMRKRKTSYAMAAGCRIAGKHGQLRIVFRPLGFGILAQRVCCSG